MITALLLLLLALSSSGCRKKAGGSRMTVRLAKTKRRTIHIAQGIYVTGQFYADESVSRGFQSAGFGSNFSSVGLSLVTCAKGSSCDSAWLAAKAARDFKRQTTRGGYRAIDPPQAPRPGLVSYGLQSKTGSKGYTFYAYHSRPGWQHYVECRGTLHRTKFKHWPWLKKMCTKLSLAKRPKK